MKRWIKRIVSLICQITAHTTAYKKGLTGRLTFLICKDLDVSHNWQTTEIHTKTLKSIQNHSPGQTWAGCKSKTKNVSKQSENIVQRQTQGDLNLFYEEENLRQVWVVTGVICRVCAGEWKQLMRACLRMNPREQHEAEYKSWPVCSGLDCLLWHMSGWHLCFFLFQQLLIVKI